MQNLSPNHAKKLAQLYYQDKIFLMHQSGMSIRSIKNRINRHYLPRSKFKGVTLSKTTIQNMITRLKKIRN